MRGGGITRWLCPPLRWLGRICRLHPVNSAKIRKFLGNTATMSLSCKKSNVFSFATASRRWRTLTVHEFLARVAADAFPTSSPVKIRHCSFLNFLIEEIWSLKRGRPLDVRTQTRQPRFPQFLMKQGQDLQPRIESERKNENHSPIISFSTYKKLQTFWNQDWSCFRDFSNLQNQSFWETRTKF